MGFAKNGENSNSLGKGTQQNVVSPPPSRFPTIKVDLAYDGLHCRTEPQFSWIEAASRERKKTEDRGTDKGMLAGNLEEEKTIEVFMEGKEK